jgi:uncharacterized protein YndB with AHSA1/START domain
MLEKSNPALTVTLPSDWEIVMTRVFDAPRSLVFEAFTKPEHVKHWWGIRNMTLPVCEMDLRPGGAWRRVLRKPDGTEVTFKGVYREVVPPERLVYTECYDDPGVGSPEWLTTVTFEEQDGKTKWTGTCLHSSVEVRNGHLQSGMEEGVKDVFARLDDLLVSMQQGVA